MKNIIKNILIQGYKILFHLFGRILPKDNNLVVFESFLGKQYSDNPRAIYEYLHAHHPQLRLIWSVDKESAANFHAAGIPAVKRLTFKWLIMMNRAKYWVSNSRLPTWLPKTNSTVYLQTWHGTPLKRLAMDMDEVHMAGVQTNEYKQDFLKSVHKWDYLISPNGYSSEIFKRAFLFEKELLETGYPRNDYLITHNNQDEIRAIKAMLKLPVDKKIILYAPTWRDNQFYKQGSYKFDVPLDLALMKEQLGNDYIILLRMHYFVAEEIDLSGLDNFVFNCSYHEDIRELYLISDLLITDYSSVFFDYAILKRPMLFFVDDLAEYRDKLRGFYFDFEKEAPGPLVKTTEELVAEIQSGHMTDQYDPAFHEKFCSLEDGLATKRVIEQVFHIN